MEGNKKLVIIGAGEFAEIAYEYFTHDSDYQVVAFAVEEAYKTTDQLFDLPVVDFEKLKDLYSPQTHEAFVAVTFTQLNRVRTRLYDYAKEQGYTLATYVSSNASVWHNVKFGDNCFVFENNVIQYHAEIGNNVVLWSGNHVGHRAKIASNCFISSHVVVSGYVNVGENCFFGVNSTLGDSITIGKNCLIGAGAVVTKDAEENLIYVGNPAKPRKISTLDYFKITE